MKEKARKRFGIGWQVFVIVLVLVLLAVLFMGGVVVQRETNRMKSDAKISMSELIAMERAMFDLKYQGDWEVKDNQLLKGGVTLNDNNEIMDFISESSGNLATLFLNDTRIATSVKDDQGNRRTGTQADAEIAKQVLQEGKPYYGNANVAGTIMYSAYEPVKTKDGKIVGMMFLGDPELKKNLEDSWKEPLKLTLLIELVVVLIALLVTALYSFRIKKKLERIETKLSLVTAGDLTSPSVAAGHRDEIDSLSHSVNQMNEDLKTIVTNISDVSHQVAASSEELSAIAEQTSASTEHVGSLTENLADSAEQQMQLVKRTSDTLEEITGELRSMSELSVVAVQGMIQTAKEANIGFDEGREVLEQMREVMKSTDQTYASIGKLAERSGEIGGIAQIMTNLSKQTNLLALNAAIEASRAGESGRGFAVVATEIRKLAEQSAASAQQVAELVEVILTDTAQAKEWITADREAVIAGTEKTERINEALGSILAKVTDVTDKLKGAASSVQTVNDSTKDLAAMMSDVNNAADQATEATQQVSASCEEQLAAMQEIASSSMALASLAEQLQLTLSRFKI
ncbi:methyl-accepting chemotaxis protein [Gorillibacterium timonense]|uniref:methyl-accepting chemotaxis protein n=1 Tax=Gorillibacterium timonense TaxID=1689269 RepID=UPI00071E4080|nr:methyl-accepting chemotaxis protein [Gorillibacterium timonense]